MHIPFPLTYRHYQIRPILHSFGIPPSCIHMFSIAFQSTRLSTHQPSPTYLAPLHLPLSSCIFILCIADSTSSCPISSTSTSLLIASSGARGNLLLLKFPFSISLKYTAHYLNASLLSVISLSLLSLITAPLFTSLPSPVLSRALLNIIFSHLLIKLSVQSFLHTPPCSVHRLPDCLLLLAVHML